MRRTCTHAGYVIVAIATGACATARPALDAEEARLAPRTNASGWHQRWSDTPSMTAYDALELIPGYARRVNGNANPRFVLQLDGAFSTDIGILKSIRSSDVREIRLIGESRSIASGGAIELIVTTVASAGIR